MGLGIVLLDYTPFFLTVISIIFGRDGMEEIMDNTVRYRSNPSRCDCAEVLDIILGGCALKG